MTKRWELLLGTVLVAGSLYDLFRRDWLSFGQYLSFGAGLLLGPDRPGPRKIPAIALLVLGSALFLARIVLRR